MAGRRTAGWWYPWIFVAGMLVVVVVNVALAAFAVGTFPGLETVGHYRKGLAYNTNIEAARLQAQRGWRMELSFAPEAEAPEEDRRGRLRAAFTDHDGNPLSRLTVEAVLTRPTREGYDFRVPLSAEGGGVYSAVIGFPLPGQWAARILAGEDDQHFQEIRRLLIR